MNDLVKSTWEHTTGCCWPRVGKFTAGEYAINLEDFTAAIIQECLNECSASRTPLEIHSAIAQKFNMLNKE